MKVLDFIRGIYNPCFNDPVTKILYENFNLILDSLNDSGSDPNVNPAWINETQENFSVIKGDFHISLYRRRRISDYNIMTDDLLSDFSTSDDKVGVIISEYRGKYLDDISAYICKRKGSCKIEKDYDDEKAKIIENLVLDFIPEIINKIKNEKIKNEKKKEDERLKYRTSEINYSDLYEKLNF